MLVLVKVEYSLDKIHDFKCFSMYLMSLREFQQELQPLFNRFETIQLHNGYKVNLHECLVHNTADKKLINSFKMLHQSQFFGNIDLYREAREFFHERNVRQRLNDSSSDSPSPTPSCRSDTDPLKALLDQLLKV